MEDSQRFCTAQSERVERARSAVRGGKFLITRIGPCEWTVRNGGKEPYVVSLKTMPGEGPPLQGDLHLYGLSAERHGYSLQHIHAVRLLEAEQNQTGRAKHEKGNHS